MLGRGMMSCPPHALMRWTSGVAGSQLMVLVVLEGPAVLAVPMVPAWWWLVRVVQKAGGASSAVVPRW